MNRSKCKWNVYILNNNKIKNLEIIFEILKPRLALPQADHEFAYSVVIQVRENSPHNYTLRCVASQIKRNRIVSHNNSSKYISDVILEEAGEKANNSFVRYIVFFRAYFKNDPPAQTSYSIISDSIYYSNHTCHRVSNVSVIFSPLYGCCIKNPVRPSAIYTHARN